MENNRRIEQLVSKLLSGDISREELRELNAWYDLPGEGQTGEIPDEVSENKDIVKTRIFLKLQRAVHEDKSGRNRVFGSIWQLRKIAAVFVIVFGGTYLMVTNWGKINDIFNPVAYTTYSTQEDKRSNFVLPDGSEVWLNANSELKYTNRFSKKIRKIHLKGEAFFDVARDEAHPFIIQAKDITTTVLGTSFNVKAIDGEDIEVTVATGKVKVTSTALSEKPAILLTPNQQATYNPVTQSFTQKEVDPDIYLTWKDEKLVFNEISLSKAIAILEKRYEVEIVLKNEGLANCIIIGEHENESLENVLKAMQFVLGFEYTFKALDLVEITGNGCGQ